MPQGKHTRPNVLFIICHDLGTQLGCYGDPSLRTTNLDSLTETGVRFDNYFCTTPLCSPSRGSILTGRYPHSNGLNGLTHRGFSLNPDERCLPELLAEAGYDTLLFGFQHEASDPRRLGYRWVSERGEPARCALITPKVAEFLRGYAGGARQPDAGGREAPFLAMVGFSEVHRDFKHECYQPDDPAKVFLPPYLTDTPEVREDFADFHGLIHAADASVGDLLQTLAETGLAEDTWVIFTTDHGVPFPRAKSTLYDPGIRTALIMRWPAGFAGGRGRPPARRGRGRGPEGAGGGEEAGGLSLCFAPHGCWVARVPRCKRSTRARLTGTRSAGARATRLSPLRPWRPLRLDPLSRAGSLLHRT